MKKTVNFCKILLFLQCWYATVHGFVIQSHQAQTSPFIVCCWSQNAKHHHHTIGNEATNTRREWISHLLVTSAASAMIGLTSSSSSAQAAPPIAIIAEELGYFPVTNRQGETVYVAKSVQRSSSIQAQQLAQMLQEKGVVMVGTYWCPHTSRQKELFGKEAWSKISYIECAPKGYQANPAYCIAKQVDGYPAWIFPNGKMISGERPLSLLAQEIGFRGFRDDLEKDIPPLGGASCKLK